MDSDKHICDVYLTSNLMHIIVVYQISQDVVLGLLTVILMYMKGQILGHYWIVLWGCANPLRMFFVAVVELYQQRQRTASSSTLTKILRSIHRLIFPICIVPSTLLSTDGREQSKGHEIDTNRDRRIAIATTFIFLQLVT